MTGKVPKTYYHLPPELLTCEHRVDGFVLSIVGELALEARVQRQSHLLLGELVFVTPRDIGEYIWQEGFAFRVQVYVQTHLCFIRRKSDNLCAIMDADI